MKNVKRTLALALVLVMMMSVMVVPAFAASEPWQTRFSKFTHVNVDNYHNYPNYVKAAQRFFLCNPATADLIKNNGGVDGFFGDATARAAKAFQSVKGLDVDGRVGPQTWKAIAADLTLVTYTSPNYYIFYKNGQKVIYVNGTSTYNYYYYTTEGSLGSVFHRA